jgi:hypothetical protein
MDVRIWTVHRKPGRDLEVVDDGFSLFALLVPPIWAIWNYCWVTLGVIVIVPGVVGVLIHPLAVSPVAYGIGLILALEGGQVRRFEMRLRGWKESGVVEAGSPEGAEEMFLTGRAA